MVHEIRRGDPSTKTVAKFARNQYEKTRQMIENQPPDSALPGNDSD
jgi:hypothetical protein